MPTRLRKRRHALVENVDFNVGIPMPRDTPDEDELSLRDIWRVLLKRRWTVAGCAALVLALALVSATVVGHGRRAWVTADGSRARL